MGMFFQGRVAKWMSACFGPEISADRQERNHRFLEEALELVQACGATRHEALALVDYVYGRPKGEPAQEVGGVLVTLAAHCQAHGIDMGGAGETELARVWTKVEQIRAKQATKPRNSPLPAEPCSAAADNGLVEALRGLLKGHDVLFLRDSGGLHVGGFALNRFGDILYTPSTATGLATEWHLVRQNGEMVLLDPSDPDTLAKVKAEAQS